MDIGNYKFVNPEFLWILSIIPLMVFWYIWKYNKKHPEQKITSLLPFENIKKSRKEISRHSLIVLRLIAISLIIIAIARPQTILDKEKITSEGIDIVLALDISGSMLARDFSPNRLEAAKKVAIDFISGRKNDRIGLAVFAGESFTQCPITTDHTILKNLINKIKSGMIEDGTAIGLGLATAVNRLRESPGKSKVIILLTDGVNNAGQIHPLTAAEIAKTFNIRVYTIGVGSRGMAPYPRQTNMGIRYYNEEVKIDEALLKQIAEMTGVQYYRATNNKKLKDIYKEIDQLEKSKIEVTSFQRFNDKFLSFAFIGCLIFIIELFSRYTIFKNFP